MRAAIALVNSAEDPDMLVAVQQLSDFYAEYEYTGRFDGDDAELRAVRRLRPVLRKLFTSTRDDAVVIVNTSSTRMTRIQTWCATAIPTGICTR